MAGGHGGIKKSMSLTHSHTQGRKKHSENGGHESSRKSLTSSHSIGQLTGERTVKRLRLSKALTIPDTTSVLEACRRMAARRVDALLLTDSNALLCGILTDKDITTKVIAYEISLEDTPVSRVMTRNPVFVLSDTLAVEALQKMVNGKFRHLPVVEDGEVIALLDIAKCLHDAISRMERAAEKGKAMASAVEGADKHRATPISGPNTFMESLRDKMFRPSLSTIIADNPNFEIITLSPTDTVVMATKKMLDFHTDSAVVTVDGKLQGIITSKDILIRVIAQDLPPESTSVEKVMTPNPECATVDTSIVDALHTMHDGKFLHLPVVDRDGTVVAVTDVLHITHAAIASVGNTAGAHSEATTSVMQKFWDSAMALSHMDDEDETHSENSLNLISGGMDVGRSASNMPTTFAFKIQDRKGRMHRFSCDTRSLTELTSALIQRMGNDIDRSNLPHILYEDEENDKVILGTDNDLVEAVEHARLAGSKVLKLFLDHSKTPRRSKASSSRNLNYRQSDSWTSTYSAVAVGAVLVVGLGIFAFMRRSRN